MIFKEINQNTICHRLILKGSDIDITEKVYFKCYKFYNWFKKSENSLYNNFRRKFLLYD